MNETVAMVFSFYLDATGGSPIWYETQNVTVNKGVYNVSLGEVTPISLPFGLPYYLGVQVGADPEMTPRQPMTSVGYAFRSRNVDIVPGHTHSGTDITTPFELSGASAYTISAVNSYSNGYGLNGTSSGASGSGVHGYASATGAVTNFGGYFSGRWRLWQRRLGRCQWH